MELNRICVANREDNGYHDSYFYATFYEDGKFVEEMIGTTAFAGGMYDYPINAPKEILELYRKTKQEELEEIERKTPGRGKRCRLRNARKYQGIGTILKIEPNRYNYGRGLVAVVKFDDGRITSADIGRVELVYDEETA